MSLVEVILVGLGLSMDAAAVSMTNGMVYRRPGKAKTLAMPLMFGIFQALMPVCGYLAGGLFADLIRTYSGYVILLILGVIGLKMIKDGFAHGNTEHVIKSSLTYKIIFMQAIATSIDAFAVGIGFALQQVNIAFAAGTIGITTFCCSLAAIFIGRRFGNILGNKAEILGGVILVLIGIKAILPIG